MCQPEIDAPEALAKVISVANGSTGGAPTDPGAGAINFPATPHETARAAAARPISAHEKERMFRICAMGSLKRQKGCRCQRIGSAIGEKGSTKRIVQYRRPSRRIPGPPGRSEPADDNLVSPRGVDPLRPAADHFHNTPLKLNILDYLAQEIHSISS